MEIQAKGYLVLKIATAFGLVLSAFIMQAEEKLPLQPEATIALPDVKGRFDHLAVDPGRERLFVAALGNKSLEVIDLKAGKLLVSLQPNLSKPTGVLFLAETNEVVVANGGEGNVKILGPNFRIKHTLTQFEDADNLRFDPATKLVWLGYGDGALAVIDPFAGRVVGTVSLPKHPESFQLELNGNRIFVNVPDAREVAVIDRTQRKAIAKWPMEKFQANFPMALDEPNQRLFIGCRKPPRLVVLNTATGQPVADVQTSGDTDDLFYDTKRKRIYISCGEGFIDVVAQKGPFIYERISRITTVSGARTSLYDPGLDRFYLAVPRSGAHPSEIRVYRPE